MEAGIKTAAAALLAGLMVAATSAPAAEPPMPETAVGLVARDQPIADFLREFFAATGQRAAVDPQVTGKINGEFRGPPKEIWDKISRAFNLVAYYDGAIVSIYRAGQVESRTIRTGGGQASALERQVANAGIGDAHNRLKRASQDTVIATGVPRYLARVEDLASGLPRLHQAAMREIAPAGTARAHPAVNQPDMIEPYELRVFYLRYARADDTVLNAGGRQIRVPGVGSTLSRVMGDGSPVTGGIVAGYGDLAVRQSQPRLGGRGLDAVPPDPSRAAPYEDEYLGLPPLRPDRQSGQPPYRAPNTGPRIAIDPSLNALVVRDRPENMPAYEGLVQALDVRPQIVELEATIIDLNIDKLRELGFNWRIRSEGFNAVFGSDIVRRSGIPATDIANTGSVNNGLSLHGVIGSGREFIGRINALAEEGAARIVSRPQLVTLSNVEAVFDRTRTFYVRVAGDRQVDLFNVTAGTVLRVNPHVLTEDGRPRIRMVIGVEDGTVLNTKVDDIPVVERASVNTQALINEGEGLLLGGLTVNAQYDAESGIPLLKDIPVLGNLFKSSRKQRQRTERLFLITPRLIDLDTAAGVAVPAATVPESGLGMKPSAPLRAGAISKAKG
ncbi:MAG: type III secretion system outer membrane ring subunit SctC [Novosphingobium sp.]